MKSRNADTISNGEMGNGGNGEIDKRERGRENGAIEEIEPMGE